MLSEEGFLDSRKNGQNVSAIFQDFPDISFFFAKFFSYLGREQMLEMTADFFRRFPVKIIVLIFDEKSSCFQLPRETLLGRKWIFVVLV